MHTLRSTAGLTAVMLLALCGPGCEQFESWRQGSQSTYRAELKQIAEDVNRDEFVRAPRKENFMGPPAPDDVVQVDHRRSSSLLGSVTLQQPMAIDPNP